MTVRFPGSIHRIQQNIKVVNTSNTQHRLAISLAAVLFTLSPVTVPAAIRLVWLDSPSPGAPFDQWANAAHDIQTAVNAADPGDTVWVTNGVYATGGAITPGFACSNRVVVAKPITVQSINGRDVTTILGQGPLGPTAMRCLYLTNGATLSGFTLSNGFTFDVGGDSLHDRRGGGVLLDGGGVLSNCLVAANCAHLGGGVYGYLGGYIFDSLIQSNQAVNYAGGLYYSMAGTNIQAIVQNCRIIGNWAGTAGGLRFASNGLAINCEIRGNWATNRAGGVSLENGGTLVNCTVTSNTVSAGDGGGVWLSAPATVRDSQVRGNIASGSGGGLFGNGTSACVATNCDFQWNQATAGGGIHLDGSGAVWNSLIASNQSLNYGGGISLSNNGLVANCQILGNTANNGSGAWNYSRAYSGGGVWSADASGVISNSVVSGCLAGMFGGGIYQGTVCNCQIISNSTYDVQPVRPAYLGGGGICGSTVYDSMLRGNRANNDGGGAFGATLHRCTFKDNSCGDGGYGSGAYGCGAYDSLFVGNSGKTAAAVLCTLYGCTLTANFGFSGISQGGVLSGTLYNSIVYGNSGGDVYGADAYSSCAPDLAAGANGNVTNAPVFANAAAGDYTLNLSSPCINAGTNFDWMTSSTDLVGNPRILGGRVDMGAYEDNPLQSTGDISAALSADYPVVAVSGKVNLTADVAGRATGCLWQWDDGTTVSNVFNVSHTFGTVGDHTVRFAVWNLDTTNFIELTVHVVPPATHYVSLTGAHTPPFTNWTAAATNIQAAIEAALPGEFVLVASGVYSNGNVLVGGVPNQVVLNKTPLMVSSVDGPGQTIILANGSWGRGAFVGNGGLLAGFTITSGFTDVSGGGVWCESGGVVFNCTIVGNSSTTGGGGVYGGTLWRCTLSHNSSASPWGGSGAYGGGALDAVLYNCLVVSNSASGYVEDEYWSGLGGGAFRSTLNNCTVAANDIGAGFGGGGRGTYDSTLWNCIVYDNSGVGNNVEGGSANYTCMPTLAVAGVGNITNAPLFLNQAAGDYRLAAGSPCINAGTNRDWMLGALDLAGLPRIAGGTVDLGAYEFQGGGPFSITAITLLSPTLLQLEWPSVLGATYQLQSATNLPAVLWLNEGAPFPGTGGVLTTNLPIAPAPAKFFRVQSAN